MVESRGIAPLACLKIFSSLSVGSGTVMKGKGEGEAVVGVQSSDCAAELGGEGVCIGHFLD